MNDQTDSASFNANYQTLTEIAEKLRSQQTADIDSLVPMVERATLAYKACKQRIQAVKQALEEHLANEQATD